MNILILTTGPLSSAPRMIKSADCFALLGHKVRVLSVLRNEEFKSRNDGLLINPAVEHTSLLWYNCCIPKIVSIFFFVVQKYFHIPLNCSFKYTWFVRSKLKQINNIDLFYTNSVMGLEIVGPLNNKDLKLAYDIEDAFPYTSDKLCMKTIELERKFILKFDFYTIASPFYRDLYWNLYGLCSPMFLVLNVFSVFNPIKGSVVEKSNKKSISLYWVSQTIGLDRGLQDVFSVFHKLDNRFELHIRGSISQSVKMNLISFLKDVTSIHRIFFHPIVNQKDLSFFTSQHDIGLALEPGFGINNEYAISNKIFDYLSCGLSVVASDTEGHKYAHKFSQGQIFIYERGNFDSLLNAIFMASDRSTRNECNSIPDEFTIKTAYQQLGFAIEHSLK